MTKFVKMSLAAAVAVAGLTSTAAASETSYSGKLYVEHYAKGSETAGVTGPTTTGFEIDFDVTAKRKVSDTLTAVVGVEADTDNSDQVKTADKTVGLEEAYFAYANKGAAVKFGRQGISTPNTDGEDGEGAFATYTMGNITAAAAYFPSNAVAAGHDVTALALLGSAGMVNFEAWQVNAAGVVENTTLVVSGNFGGVSVEARNASSSYDAAGSKDGNTMKVVASGKVSDVALTGIYASTDKDGAAFVTDATSANAVELVQLVSYNSTTATSLSDATIFAVVGSTPVTDKGSVKLAFAMADFNTNDDASEVVAQYTHSLAKSTTASVRYSTYGQTVSNVETTKTHTRVDLTYKF